jgi:branched-chain amino acid transport system ATP-binding protein
MGTVLEATGVTKRFAGIVALDDVSLQVESGERVGLIGPNGAGKTTFFNCVLGVVRPDGGRVLLEGRDIGGLPVHARALLGIGRTFQRIELFTESTVREHLLIAERTRRGDGRLWKDLLGRGRPRPDEIARCDEVLELLGLADLAEEPIERLSLGKGRLVEVGRALMTDPKLLLLDEPSSGLDRDETADLARTLQDVQAAQGFAILLVEHDVELVSSFTERCYVLDFGCLIASGPTADVMASDEVRTAYFGDVEVAS